MNKQEELLNRLREGKFLSIAQTDDIRTIATSTNKSLVEVLFEKKIIEPEKIIEICSVVYGLKYQNLTSKNISDQIINLIPVEVAENYKIICFDRQDDKISVGLLDPENLKAFEAVDFLTKEAGLVVDYYLISNQSFNNAFKQYKTISEEISVALRIKADEELKKKEAEADGQFEEIIGSAPVIKIVSVIIRHAVEGGASDIHIEPLQKESRVRYRIDGILRTSLVLPRNIHDAIVSRIKVMANLKLDETRIPQDGRIRQIVNGKEVDFRISIIPLVGEEKVVMRVLDVSKGAPTLKDLGFSGDGLAIINENIKKTNKLFLVVGPTGSGKSTTIYSVLDMVNREGVNISTLEDPVEYFMPGINQSQIKPEVGFTFAAGLRALLRQDPNIIMVGEIRDNETAELAIHASLTGHFVLTTMHTNDALGAIPRLLDMHVEPFLLGSTLSTVVAQRLVRKNCPHCKAEELLPEEVVVELKAEIDKIPLEVLKKEVSDFNPELLKCYKSIGCPRCANIGFIGRLVISEVIDVNDKIRNKIIDDGSGLREEDIRESQNFLSMKQDGMIKVLQGTTTYEEVLRVTRN